MELFASFAYVQAEPILSEIYRADDPTSVPLFRVLDPANHVYEDPLVDPERLHDFEVGAGLDQGDAFARLSGFWMDFRDEIVPLGQIDALGNPITGNAARSTHQGIEVEFGSAHPSGLGLSGNVDVQPEPLRRLPRVRDAGVFNDYSGNSIAGFPNRMAHVTLGYRRGGLAGGAHAGRDGAAVPGQLGGQREGPVASAGARLPAQGFIEEHAVLNGALLTRPRADSSEPAPLGPAALSLEVRGMNLTDLRYETAGYVFVEIPISIRRRSGASSWPSAPTSETHG